MGKKLASILLAVLLIFLASSAYATAILDPVAGGDYLFRWYDLGPIDDVFDASDISTSLGSDWSITVAENSYLTFVTAYDDFVTGDVYGLILDGSSVPWTTTYIDGSGYFHGEYEDLVLTAGTHTISFETLVGDGGAPGDGWASFSGTRVPEPATLFLLGSGLLGMAVARRKIRK